MNDTIRGMRNAFYLLIGLIAGCGIAFIWGGGSLLP